MPRTESAAPLTEGGTPPAGRSGSSLASTQREASVFLAWGAVIILLAHGVEVLHAGAANWPALGLRLVWVALLAVQAVLFRRASRGVAAAGAQVAIFGSALLDLGLLAVTGRSASPLLAFTPVLAAVLPFMAFEALWAGLAASTVLGTGLLLWADGAPPAGFLSLANAGGGALACGVLLSRTFQRARAAEEERRFQLAEAMASVKTLSGLLPICAWCRRVRRDDGYWQQIEAYVSTHTDARFSHGLCEDCDAKHFHGDDQA